MYIFVSRNSHGISVERFEKKKHFMKVSFDLKLLLELRMFFFEREKNPAAHENSSLCYMEHTISFFICVLREIETNFGCCYCCSTFINGITIKFYRLAHSF